MTKAAWRAHIIEQGISLEQRDAVKAHIATGCKECEARKRTYRANKNARIKRATYAALGMVRGVDSMGRTIYE